MENTTNLFPIILSVFPYLDKYAVELATDIAPPICALLSREFRRWWQQKECFASHTCLITIVGIPDNFRSTHKRGMNIQT